MSTRTRLRLNAQHIALIRDNFNIIDVDRDDKINKAQFAALFRSLGQVVSNKRLDWITSEIFKDKQEIDFDTFVTALVTHYNSPPNSETIKEAFALLDDSKTGFISPAKLTQLLTSKGEPLTKEQVAQFFKIMDIDETVRKIDYIQLVQDMRSKITMK